MKKEAMDPLVSQAPLPKRHPFLILGTKAFGVAGTTSMCGVSITLFLIFPEGFMRTTRFSLPGRTFILLYSNRDELALPSRY